MQPTASVPAGTEFDPELCCLFDQYADNDERINAAWPPYETALKASGVKYEAFKYPGTQHGFHNDATPRFDPPSAAQAWGRTLALFNRTLR